MKIKLFKRYLHVQVCLVTLSLLLFLIPLATHAKIVFSAKHIHEGETAHSVYTMEDDGSNVRRITNPKFYDRLPRWFPDGKQIVFERDLSDGKSKELELYIIDATGLNEHQFIENHPTDHFPVVSPDGKHIAFNSNRSGHYDIYTVNLESGHLQQVTNNEFVDGRSHKLDWSPDGKQIVYQQIWIDPSDYIWIIDTAGRKIEQLTPLNVGATLITRYNPSWSPSGKYIMYSEAESTLDHKDVAEARLVIHHVWTGDRVVHKFPRWSHFGGTCWMGNDHTVLISFRENFKDPATVFNIYRYDLDSRKMTSLTNLPNGHAYYPNWIEGSLVVSPLEKLTTQWGKLKQID